LIGRVRIREFTDASSFHTDTMKDLNSIGRIGSRALRGLAAVVLALGSLHAGVARAQEDYVAATFDSEDQVSGWARWWGAAAQSYAFDDSVDAAGSTASGSLKATIDFDLATFAGDNQFAVRGDFPGGATVDGTKYTNLVMKLRWAATSPKTAGGDFGYLEYGFRNSDWSQTWLGGQSIAAASGDAWTEIKVPIAPTLAKLDTIAGVVLKLWSGGGGGLTGTTVFWVDDVKLIAKSNTEPPPAPAIRLRGATAGLRLAASAAGQQYQRQNIRTLAADADGNPRSYGWLGRSEPVTYSFTVKDYPDAAHSGFQTHLLLVPEAGMPYGPGDTSIDWNAPQTIFVQLANNADGTAAARFMYKTNQPSGNSMFWNEDPATGPAGTLAVLDAPSAVGTWSVTFKNDTEVTMAGPGGAITNFTLPSASAALFAEPLFAYFGSQPNQMANIGQAVTMSSISIVGNGTPLQDSFTGDALDTTNWQVTAADAPGITQVPPTAKYWLAWDAPGTGFVVQSAPKLGAGAWVEAGLSNVVQVGSEKMVIVPAANLPSGGAGFFRLAKP
jgi:hypothetical protein